MIYTVRSLYIDHSRCYFECNIPDFNTYLIYPSNLISNTLLTCSPRFPLRNELSGDEAQDCVKSQLVWKIQQATPLPEEKLN